jgi:hypothetical protein
MSNQDLPATALRRRRRKLVRELPPLDQVLRGALTETYKRCGRPNCHCADGPGHGPKRYLVTSQPGGRPRRAYVPNAAHEQVVDLIDNHRRLRAALNEICAINAELLRRREDLG